MSNVPAQRPRFGNGKGTIRNEIRYFVFPDSVHQRPCVYNQLHDFPAVTAEVAPVGIPERQTVD